MTLDTEKLTQLLASISGFSAALKARLEGKLDLTGTAADSTLFEGKTLAQIKTEIESAAGEDLAAIQTALDTFIAREDNPHNVTKTQVGLGNVSDFGIATDPEAVAGVVSDKYLVPSNLAAFWADKVGTAPETLDTIAEIAAALDNNPDAISILQTIASDNSAAIALLQTGKLDVGAQAADAALFDGKTRAEIVAEAQAGVDLSQVVLKTDDVSDLVVGETTVGDVAALSAQNADAVVVLGTSISNNTAAIDLKLDATAQAVNSALLEGKTVAEIIELSNGSSSAQLVNFDEGVYANLAGNDWDAIASSNPSGRYAGFVTVSNLLPATSSRSPTAYMEVVITPPDDTGSFLIQRTVYSLDARGYATELLPLYHSAYISPSFNRSDINRYWTALATNDQIADLNLMVIPDIYSQLTDLQEAAIAKATEVEAIDGTDDAKYITALTLKAKVDAAIAALVDGAPTALDTLKELADALSNNSDAVAALVTQIDGKLGKTEQAADSVLLDGKTVAEIVAQAQDGVDLTQVVLKTDDFGQYIVGEETLTALRTKIFANSDDILALQGTTADNTTALVGKLGATEQAVDSAKLEGVDKAGVVAEAVAAVDLSGKLDVTAQAADSLLLEGQTLAQIQASIRGGEIQTIQAVQDALDAYIASAVVPLKASSVEAVAGTDDDKYITALALKAKVDDAIAALVDGAPTALDTLNELATALADGNDAVAALTLAVDGKLGKTEQAADSALLEGKAIADLTASDTDVATGTATDKFVTPAALASKTDAQDLAIAGNATAIEDVVNELIAAFDTAADDMEAV